MLASSPWLPCYLTIPAYLDALTRIILCSSVDLYTIQPYTISPNKHANTLRIQSVARVEEIVRRFYISDVRFEKLKSKAARYEDRRNSEINFAICETASLSALGL